MTVKIEAIDIPEEAKRRHKEMVDTIDYFNRKIFSALAVPEFYLPIRSNDDNSWVTSWEVDSE